MLTFSVLHLSQLGDSFLNQVVSIHFEVGIAPAILTRCEWKLPKSECKFA